MPNPRVSRSRPTLQDPDKWVPLKLTKVTKLSHNTKIYRFAYSDPEATSGMTVASCLLTKAPIGSEKKDGTKVRAAGFEPALSGLRVVDRRSHV